MQYFCNHSYIFERRFLPNFLLEHIVVMIWLIRDNITDQLSFYLRTVGGAGAPAAPRPGGPDGRKCLA